MNLPSIDPRTKVIIFSSAIMLAFICKDIAAIAVLVAAALTASLLSEKKRLIVNGLKSMAPLLIVAFLLWSFMHEWSIFQRYGGGVNLQLGAFMSLRLLLILIVSIAFIATIGISDLVKALNSFRLPYWAVFMLGLTVRHLYTIAEDYKAIKEAQASRGLELDKGSLIKRIRNYIPVLIPLFVRSIENAEKLALAMELKSFSFNRRRYLKNGFKPIDLLLILGSTAAILLAILHYWVGAI